MSSITRTYTFTDGTDAFGSQVDSEIQNIVTTWNNHDAGTSRWTVMDATTTKKNGTATLQIMQVVQTASTTDFTTTSSTFATTNCAGTITPTTTSSTIFVMAMGILKNNAIGTTQAYASLFRGSTNLGGGGNNMFQEIAAGTAITGAVWPCSFTYYDSPASVAAQTYSVKILSSDNTNQVAFGNSSKTVMILVELL